MLISSMQAIIITEVIFIATKNITLFIDIEWSQPTNVFEIEKSQMLQIAGIGVNQDG